MKKFWERVVFLAFRHGPWAIIASYVVLATAKLDLPAVHYDESLYVNAALGGIDKITFITKSIGELPVLLMPYIGALKSWLMAPVFALFGVSPVSMRLPFILLAAAALFFMYWLFKKHLGRAVALSVLAITAIDASFIAFTRLDLGPVVLDFGLKLVGLWLLLSFVQNPRYRYLLLFWATMLVGEFNKLNFLWYVHAFGLALIVVYGRQLWVKLTPALRKRFIATSAAAYALCVGYYLLIIKSYPTPGGFGFVGFDYMLTAWRSMVSGSWFYNYALSPSPIGMPVVFTVIITLVCVAGVLLLPRFKAKVAPNIRRMFVFSLVFLAGLFAQIAVTKAATAGWHYFSVYPLLGLLTVLGVYIIARWLNWRPWATTTALTVLTIGLVGYNLIVYKQYIDTYGKPVSNVSWSDANYELIDFARGHREPFVSLDWGTHVQLLGLDPVKNKYYQVFGPISIDDRAASEFVYKSYMVDLPGAYYITHATDGDILPRATASFFELAKQRGLNPVKVQTIADDGQPIYTLYQLRPGS